MLTAIFAITTAVCAVGWWLSYVGVQILIELVKARGTPTEEELDAAASRAKQNLLRSKR